MAVHKNADAADLAIWMRRAGVPVEVVAHSLGVAPGTVSQYTRGHKDAYNKSAYIGMEFQILHAWQEPAQRGRKIANGRRALKAYRDSKCNVAVPERDEA